MTEHKKPQYTLHEIFENTKDLGNRISGSQHKTFISSKHDLKRLYNAYKKDDRPEFIHMVCKISLAGADEGYSSLPVEKALSSPLAYTKDKAFPHSLFKPKSKTNLVACLEKCEEIKLKKQEAATKKAEEAKIKSEMYGYRR